MFEILCIPDLINLKLTTLIFAKRTLFHVDIWEKNVCNLLKITQKKQIILSFGNHFMHCQWHFYSLHFRRRVFNSLNKVCCWTVSSRNLFWYPDGRSAVFLGSVSRRILSPPHYRPDFAMCLSKSHCSVGLSKTNVTHKIKCVLESCPWFGVTVILFLLSGSEANHKTAWEMPKYCGSVHPSSSLELNLIGNKARYPGILPAHVRVLVTTAPLSWPLHTSSEKRKMIARFFDCCSLEIKRPSMPFTFLI